MHLPVRSVAKNSSRLMFLITEKANEAVRSIPVSFIDPRYY